MFKHIFKKTSVKQFCGGGGSFVGRQRRTFLSESYKCTDAWNARLNTPILQKIQIDPFYYELEQKFQQKGKVSAIDIDIFANRINDDGHTDELADLLNRLRLTEETTFTLDSTGHAAIRNLLEHNQIEPLISILNDRLNYGVFLDNYTVNLTLDTLIKRKDYESAAKIATIFMLEENFTHSLSTSLCLYSCYKYLKEIGLNGIAVDAKEEQAAAAAAAITATDPPNKSKEKPEIIKIRVKYLRNEFFDDHFDINNLKHAIGKTFCMIAADRNTADVENDKVLKNSLQLIGLCAYGKYSKANEFIEMNNVNDYHKDIVNICGRILNEYSGKVTNNNNNNNKDDDNTNALNTLLDNIKRIESAAHLKTNNFEELLCKSINDAVAKCESIDIDNQKQIYHEWCELRHQRLTDELERLKRAQRLQNVEQITKDMVAEEQKLWFFDNEDQLDLKIESKIVRYPKRWLGKKKAPRTIDENYVPPEIRKQI